MDEASDGCAATTAVAAGGTESMMVDFVDKEVIKLNDGE
jgi:hypothetical protein